MIAPGAPGRSADRFGFVGLGDQGGPIARRIATGGHEMTLWARRPEALDAFADTPARRAATLAELGAACDVVGICVFSDEDVAQVVAGPGGLLDGLSAGSVILVHSTVAPDLCRDLAAAASAKGVALLDAPVSGGHARAVEGRMAVMVGGDRTAFDRVAPMLQTFATQIEWLGPVGAGQLAKLVNNAMTTVTFAASLAFMEVGDQLGLDRDALVRSMLGGSGQSFGLERMAEATPQALRFALPRIEKDMTLLRALLSQKLPSGQADDIARVAITAFSDYARRN